MEDLPLFQEDEAPIWLDRSAFRRAAEQHRSIGTNLPARAVRRLAAEVIKRLADRAPVEPLTELEVTEEHLDTLCKALIWGDDDECLSLVEDFRARAPTIKSLYVDYLGAAARKLGVWWEEDHASFAEVTIGAGRIYAILRILRPAFYEYHDYKSRRAIFASVPGEKHFLGMTFAADLFRAKGWDIALWTGAGHDELIARFDETDAPFIGLTASETASIVPLVQLIVALRVCRPDAFILVSGRMAGEDNDLLDISGADFVAADVDMAIAEMERVASKA